MRLRTLLALIVCVAMASMNVRADDAPAIVELVTIPAKLDLRGPRDSRKLLVMGKTAAGDLVDLTLTAELKPAEAVASLDAEGYVTPKADGAGQITVAAGGKSVQVPLSVTGFGPQAVSFTREVMPAMSKLGCNQGTCHGAQDGKSGFKLSLRGYDPRYDYDALVDELSGRRFDRAIPSQSLMLLKPTQGVPHVGGFLFDEESRYYRLMHQWIAEGAGFDTATRVQRIEMFPVNPVLDREGRELSQVVIAHFDDGSSLDVTREAVFSSSDFNVATVDNAGRRAGVVKSLRRGETAILVRYEGAYAVNTVTVLGDRSEFAWVDSPEFNYVDTHVNTKLRKLKIQASGLCNDGEFLRRVSLDLTGMPPTADQARAFLEDPRDSKSKREAKIDELLASDAYVDHWTLKWSDLLLSSRKTMGDKGMWAYRDWIRSSLARNVPYHQFVRELITANGSAFENPAANYYRASKELTVTLENMTQVFIGTRFSCAKCHDHPFERWTQNQYYQLGAYFADVGRKPGARTGDEVVYALRSPVAVVNPRTNVAAAAAFPFEHAGTKDDPNQGLRVRLANWLTAPQNQYFATSVVNRYWSYLNGRGIIDPVDDIRSSNPPSNPELLKALVDDFVAHDMDLRHLLRTIARSHTYQRSFETNRWNEDDLQNYSHFVPRRLSAEQLFDAIMVSTQSPVTLPGVPRDFRATQLPDPTVNLEFLEMFGRAPRDIPCECERTVEVSLAQTLTLINGPTVADAIKHPQGLAARVAAANGEPAAIARDIYLSVLGRMPTEAEQAAATEFFAGVPNKAEGAEDLMWALLNSPAFLFNR
jgi:hypothetical protein